MTNKILGFQLETKQPGKGSASMEPVAAKKVLGVLITENMRFGIFMSNCCTNSGKVINEIKEQNNTSIMLEYDVWHLVKSLLKEIRHVTELQPWMETIKNFCGSPLTRPREIMNA